MEASQPNRYITPTLQANWNLAIGDIIRCFNAGLIYEAWLALQTLYDLLPPEKPELKENYKIVRNHFINIKNNFESQATESASYEAIVTSFHNGLTILRKEMRPFFAEIYQLLYKGGYLEKRSRQIDTNAPPELLEQ